MKHSEIGETAHPMWMEIPVYHENVTLDEFIVIPNHVHGIIIINDQHRDIARIEMVEMRLIASLPEDQQITKSDVITPIIIQYH